MSRIRVAKTREKIARCFEVVHELRPHLERAAFVEQVLRQQGQGYRLAYLEDVGMVRACAGYRLSESLSFGRFLYVDDLVTASAARSWGFGKELMDWLVAEARAAGCVELHLDSGVQRFAAHRFYLRERMEIMAHHFRLKL
ncbi:MAG TPA: GNAT family N-acetyltransferase [Chthoniobacter sp.]|jgi:GNAT superfamily N-acetyltransferase